MSGTYKGEGESIDRGWGRSAWSWPVTACTARWRSGSPGEVAAVSFLLLTERMDAPVYSVDPPSWVCDLCHFVAVIDEAAYS